MLDISTTRVTIDWLTGRLSGNAITSKEKRLGQLAGLFRHQEAFARMDPDQLVYTVQYWMPIDEGTPGGLFWGNTTIEPGRVGDEYFMTAGHCHAALNRAEFYAAVKGEGVLLLMNESGNTRAEKMHPGSLSYIPGGFAHRVVNTGQTPLTFVACWPSDAGHDYTTVASRGFGVRIRSIDDLPQVIQEVACGP
jgi:glucose-6-phosphate isomerase, archaeal